MINDLSITIEQGEFVVIAGASGCGKSTLLSLLAGLKCPDEGELWLADKQISGPGLERGIMFQQSSLFPWMTVKQNVYLGVRQCFLGEPKSEMMARVHMALSEVGLSDAADKYPLQLSGGMQQRAALARTLAMDSEIMLLDEPFVALDQKRRKELQCLLEQIWRQAKGKKTVILVTHDIDDVLLLADKVLFLADGKLKNDTEECYEKTP